MEIMEQIRESAYYIRGRIGSVPDIAVVLGSGLSPLASMVSDRTEIPYADIPGFPVSTVAGHESKLICGTLSGKRVIMMSGRFHYYEGYDPGTVTFYVRVLSILGVKLLYLTNASGTINTDIKPSDLVAVTDHISLFCESPLRGANLDEFGVRFPDQCFIYDRDALKLLHECADDLNITLHDGIYCYTKGPQYETPAEIRAIKALGGDIVGMSTVPEAIVASHCGLTVVCVSCVCNYAAGITGEPLSHKEVLHYASEASGNNCELVKEFISRY